MSSFIFYRCHIVYIPKVYTTLDSSRDILVNRLVVGTYPYPPPARYLALAQHLLQPLTACFHSIIFGQLPCPAEWHCEMPSVLNTLPSWLLFIAPTCRMFRPLSLLGLSSPRRLYPPLLGIEVVAMALVIVHAVEILKHLVAQVILFIHLFFQHIFQPCQQREWLGKIKVG